jgi:hypothetical protein
MKSERERAGDHFHHCLYTLRAMSASVIPPSSPFHLQYDSLIQSKWLPTRTLLPLPSYIFFSPVFSFFSSDFTLGAATDVASCCSLDKMPSSFSSSSGVPMLHRCASALLLIKLPSFLFPARAAFYPTPRAHINWWQLFLALPLFSSFFPSTGCTLIVLDGDDDCSSCYLPLSITSIM